MGRWGASGDAENLLLKQQPIVLRCARRRGPHLSMANRQIRLHFWVSRSCEVREVGDVAHLYGRSNCHDLKQVRKVCEIIGISRIERQARCDSRGRDEQINARRPRALRPAAVTAANTRPYAGPRRHRQGADRMSPRLVEADLDDGRVPLDQRSRAARQRVPPW